MLTSDDNKYLWTVHTGFTIQSNCNREFIIWSGRFYKPLNNEFLSIPKDMDYKQCELSVNSYSDEIPYLPLPFHRDRSCSKLCMIL